MSEKMCTQGSKLAFLIVWESMYCLEMVGLSVPVTSLAKVDEWALLKGQKFSAYPSKTQMLEKS